MDVGSAGGQWDPLDLVYGDTMQGHGGDLQFLPRADALERAEIMEAYNQATTWGDLRRRLPPRVYEVVLSKMNPDYPTLEAFAEEYREEEPQATDDDVEGAYAALKAGERMPQDDDPFDTAYFDEDAGGVFVMGHWYEWPQQEMLDWVPQHIQQAFGTKSYSTASGPCLVFDPKDERELVRAFEAAGYRCERDQQLVDRATGCA
jgi:hypothetical protein